MTRTMKMVAAALAGACLAVVPALASQELAAKEQLKCRACHVKTGNKLLTNKGKYYESKRTLIGYDQILRKFKRCTLCHVSAPGSAALTPAGQALKNHEVTMDHLSAPNPAPRVEPKKNKRR